MKIINIYGGLGNALFQISFALYLREQGYNVKLDMLGLDENYKRKIKHILKYCNVELEECSYYERLFSALIISRRNAKQKELKFLKKIFKTKIYIEKKWGEVPSDEYSYYHGYFQNFRLANKYISVIEGAFDKIAKLNGFSCGFNEGGFIHVRRGDYCTLHALKLHGTLEKEYYDVAVNCFDSSTSFNIFTNDRNWVVKNFNSDHFIFSNNESYIYPDIVDLYKMSRFQNGIIANSTFSFWAALMYSQKISKNIVCPKTWFADNDLQIQSHKIKSPEWVER